MITLPAETPHRLPAHAWVGALILVGAEAALASGSRLVATWFTPINSYSIGSSTVTML
jgi:hypothetical protein